MSFHFVQDQYFEPSQDNNRESNTNIPAEEWVEKQQPFIFATNFQGYMEMYNPPEVVGKYLDEHQGWFRRCALPMQAKPLGEHGYTLTIGRFGAFGYEVEPKMSVVFEVSQDHKYLMYSVEVPDYEPLGYEVEYQACMELAEMPLEASSAISPNYYKKVSSELSPIVTEVTWDLHLKVRIQFPRFIYKLSQKVIQTTGDRLLAQIVRQISPRLTYKVQKDFHDGLNLPVPPKTSRNLEIIKA